MDIRRCSTRLARAGRFLLLLGLLFLPVSARAVLRVRAEAPGPVHDGQSWDSAYTTLRAAVDAAASGDEVWVARGTYVENVSPPLPIALYGGFAGTETARATRDPRKNPTILDGGGQGDVLDIYAGETWVDGFIIQNGTFGIEVEGVSATITNNTFRDDTSALMSTDASPVVTGNVITRCFEGLEITNGAPVIGNNRFRNIGNRPIAIWNGLSTIHDNAIMGSGGAGIYLSEGVATLVNNTVIGARTGLLVDRASFTAANNLIAYNTFGVRDTTPEYATKGALTFSANCFWDNRTPFDGLDSPVGQGRNIATDPRLASPAYGDIHLLPDSPCRNAGEVDYVPSGSTDIDGQARIQGGGVDIGADESDGSTPAVTTRIVRVKPDGSDANDGSSWTKAKKSIQAAIDTASVDGGEVWVSGGTYAEPVTLRAFSYVYGGFAGTETQRGQRDPATHPSVINGVDAAPTVKVVGGYTFGTCDGFTLRGGRAGVSVMGGAPTISGNTITGAGLILEDVEGATAFTANRGETSGLIGVSLTHSAARLVRNDLQSTAPYPYFLVDIYLGSPMLTGNLLHLRPSGPVVWVTEADAVITGNTIVGRQGIAVDDWGANPVPVVVNNIFAVSAEAIARVYTSQWIIVNTRVRHNLVSHKDQAYKGYYFVPGEDTNVYGDPLFRDPAAGDYRVMRGSPAIDAGDDSVVSPGYLDLDGKPRILGAHVDIGAYEHTVSGWTVADAADALRVAAGLSPAPPSVMAALDVSADGTSAGHIDIRDAIAIIRSTGTQP